jgi:hypothetical protein
VYLRRGRRRRVGLHSRSSCSEIGLVPKRWTRSLRSYLPNGFSRRSDSGVGAQGSRPQPLTGGLAHPQRISESLERKAADVIRPPSALHQNGPGGARRCVEVSPCRWPQQPGRETARFARLGTLTPCPRSPTVSAATPGRRGLRTAGYRRIGCPSTGPR